MSEVPWKGTPFSRWLRSIISNLCPETTDECTEECKKILYSNQTNDEIQFPLIELLGDNSFDAVAIFLEFRDQILKEAALEFSEKEKQRQQQNEQKQGQRAPPPKKTAQLTSQSRYITTDTINASRYDVEATHVKRPNIKRKRVDECPPWVQKCFSNCETFNDIQTQIFDTAFNTNANMLVCAPTGAGKTNVALLTIIHEIKQHLVMMPGIPAHLDETPFLIVYITPMKALAMEITEKFKSALKHLKIVIHEYTGDTSISAAELDRSHILVATPEKWDVATRRAGENAPSARLKLLIIDEIHLLQDDRGPVLEALVARTLRQVEQQQSMIRIVGLSATLPNYTDVASFLRVTDEGLYCFGPEYRPVPLAMTLIGAKNTYKTPDASSEEVFKELYTKGAEKDMIQVNVVAIQLLKKIIAEGDQVLVFVHTRGETAKFAHLIARHCNVPITKELTHTVGRKKLQSQLKECLAQGVGIHHAGLPRNDRIFVENAFRTNAIQVLVCTATLAWGVNLPAHTVLIKGTQVYNQDHGGFEDIGILDVHQMFGRAGRPQYDTDGHAILITQSKVLPRYTSTLVNADPIDSKFSLKLEDFLNAEISLGTVTSRRDALIWARYTFMYQRTPNDELIASRLDTAVNELNNNLMIRTSLATQALQPTHLGQVASIHYIPFTAVRHFNETLHGEMDESELLDAVFSSGIFDSLIVRQNELNELDQFSPIIPINSPMDDIAGKANFLMQTYISRINCYTASLQLDQAWIADNMSRIFDAIFELAVEHGWCFLASFTLDLCKMVEQRMWWCRQKLDHPLRQLMSFPRDEPLINKLEFLGLQLDDLRTADLGELKAMLRNDQWANQAYDLANKFPIVEIEAKYQPISDQIVNIIIEAVFPFRWEKNICKDQLSFWIFIEDGNGNKMYIAQECLIDKRLARQNYTCEYLVPMSESHKYLVSMISTKFLGVGDSQIVNVTQGDKITYQHYESMPPNLRPLPVASIPNPEHRNLFGFEFFNPIQTQVFFQCYHTDDNLLIGAPTAAGKTAIAELAILRLFDQNPEAKAVYLVPLKAIVAERVLDWRMKFGSKLIELTGDFTPDSNAIASAQLIVATPEKWDAVSRGFVVRRFVQSVRLVIFDEIHLLGTDRGHIIEAVVDRMKSMPGRVRFIGLSTCLSNPLDVAEFLGVPRRGCYNFPPNMRAIPLRSFIRGFPGRHFCPRMASMNKPLSDAILEYSNGKPTLVFVPSRKQTRLTAFDLIAYATNRGDPFYYATPETSLASQKVKDPDLAHCLSFGIGLHHAGLNQDDSKIVEDLFANGKMTLLVATSTLAWGVNLPAHFVVIKGTEFHDAKTCQYVPYSTTEMQQMMGRAGRPQFDTDGVVMIFCEESRKDFLKKFINSPLPVESSLLENIYDHANAEIACGRIRTRKSLMGWLKRSFFAIRLEKNPLYYGNVTLDQVADDIVKVLTKNHCCTTNLDGQIIPTPEGRIASIFYVSYETISLFVERMEESKDIISLLRLICQAREFNEVPVRHSDDDLISNMSPRFPTEDPPDSPHNKAFYMVQYYLSHRKMPVPDFESDLSSVLDQCLRVIGCFSEIAGIKGELKSVMNCAILDQMLVQGQWYDQSPFFSMLDAQKYNKLIKSGTTLLPQLILNPEIPEDLKYIKDRVVLFKKTKFLISTDKKAIKLTLQHVSGELGSTVISEHFSRKEIQSLYILLGDPRTGVLYGHKRVQLKKDVMNVIVQSKVPLPETTWVYMCSDCYLGIDQMFPLAESQMATLQKATGKLVENVPKFVKHIPTQEDKAPVSAHKKQAFVLQRPQYENDGKREKPNPQKPKPQQEKRQNQPKQEKKTPPPQQQQNQQNHGQNHNQRQQNPNQNQKRQNQKPKNQQQHRQNQNPKPEYEDEVPQYPNERPKREKPNRGGRGGGRGQGRGQGQSERDVQDFGIRVERPRRDGQPIQQNQGQPQQNPRREQNYNPQNRQNDDQRREHRSRPRGGGRGNIDIR